MFHPSVWTERDVASHLVAATFFLGKRYTIDLRPRWRERNRLRLYNTCNVAYSSIAFSSLREIISPHASATKRYLLFDRRDQRTLELEKNFRKVGIVFFFFPRLNILVRHDAIRKITSLCQYFTVRKISRSSAVVDCSSLTWFYLKSAAAT